MTTRAMGWDRPRFQLQGAQATITIDLLFKEQLKQRGIDMDILLYIFLLHFASTALSSHAPGTPQPPDSPESSGSGGRIPLFVESREVHIIVDFLDTPETVEFSFDDELMENPQEDPELGKYQLDRDVEDAELGASNSSFDSGEQLGNDYHLDYDLSRDPQIDLDDSSFK